ncbi:hypothetical protein VST7929_02712 [Vibrio stylophorae]|uniref:SGNH hydrolase-type esterase domain-containing protein n=1 Tax=Vibrio stylophorae TaxID=659351 RepID=A0ABN8DUS4_9VIBR|nr:GDSL-type esterase/lipase family protein [Vibrio stylophorae]CAH0534756.1 hypothetical protein VST7929_02712 [Vibrio stylophorae]
MRYWIPLIFVFTGLLGCSEPQPRLNPLLAGDTVLAFGDSLTAGVGASAEQSYPAVLARNTGLNVVAAGVSGETTAQGLARFAQNFEQAQPQLVILLMGGNDILRQQSAAQTEQNLAAMIEYAQAQLVPVVLIGVPEKKLMSKTAPLYDALAERYDLVYAPSMLGDLLYQREYKSDMIHLNADGYAEFANQIEALLRAHGALN